MFALLISNLSQVLDNGILIDPHDQQSIANALLRLVADKQLWARCRENGLKNIYRYSWPEHCKAYLARVVGCKQRHPQWQREDDEYSNSDPDSPNDSLRDIHDISLNLKTLDGLGSGTSEKYLDSVKKSTDVKSPVLSDNVSKEKAEQTTSQTLRRRKRIFVVSVDCESSDELMKITKMITDVGKMDSNSSVGFILSTALPISEIYSLLCSEVLSPNMFDAFICNSGGELYYPSSTCEGKSFGRPFMADSDYHSHIDYRWGGEDLRKSLVRWAASLNAKKKETDGSVITEFDSGSDHCFAFRTKEPEMVTVL